MIVAQTGFSTQTFTWAIVVCLIKIAVVMLIQLLLAFTRVAEELADIWESIKIIA
jgi:hypothetical protein